MKQMRYKNRKVKTQILTNLNASQFYWFNI
jgi:hypothetical protein